MLTFSQKNTDYNTKINETEKKITDHDHDKYITTPEFNKLTGENFAARLKQASLVSKNDIANFLNKTDFDKKLLSFYKTINSNKTKHLLVENEFKKLQTFDSSLFIDQSHFNNDGAYLYLIFQPIHKTIATFCGFPDTISESESKELPNEKIMHPYTISFSPKLVWYNYKIKLKFRGSCLKQEDKAAFAPKIVVNLFILFELDKAWSRDLNTDFTLKFVCLDL